MNSSMINAAASMNGLQQKLDVISNNIANMDVSGYKKREVTFFDLLTSTKQQPQEFQLPGRLTPAGLNLGWGSRVGQIQINLSQGPLKMTDQPYDLAIEGNGLFEIGIGELDAAGNEVYRRAWTRSGAFALSVNPNDPTSMSLVTADGNKVMNTEQQPVVLPANYRIQIDSEGRMTAHSEIDLTEAPIELGQLKVVGITRPQLLQSIGDNVFVLPDEVMAANMEAEIIVDLAEYNANNTTPIAVRQGVLEQSNVDLGSEMTELIAVQRAYQLSARAISSSDTLMNLTNNLRG